MRRPPCARRMWVCHTSRGPLGRSTETQADPGHERRERAGEGLAAARPSARAIPKRSFRSFMRAGRAVSGWRMGLRRASLTAGSLPRGAGGGQVEYSNPPLRGDPTLRVTLHAIDAAGGYAFMVSVQLLERMVSLRRYVELVLAGELPTGPADSIEPLDLMASVRWQARALGTTSAGRADV